MKGRSPSHSGYDVDFKEAEEKKAVLKAIILLGNLYTDQDKLAELEKMYERVLQGCEKAFNPKYTSTLGTVSNLGLLYKNQGRLTEAEKMYEQALQG
jgi:tetratricopeptide (TPR) repeat protein